jgi:hypothetical protein
LYLVAPEGQLWPIDLNAAEAHFRRHWPEVHVDRQISKVTGLPYLSFDVVIDGMDRYGTYSEHPHCLTLSQGSARDWAGTIAWFLSVLPEGVPAMAMADGDFRLVPVPAGASVQEITELYERLWA